jgi:ketosteroid isomerase-like protein
MPHTRSRLLGLALLPLLTSAALAQSSDSSAVVAAVTGYHTALATGDSAAALRLLAPDAIILESGGQETLTEYRSHHLPGDIRFAMAVPSQRGSITVRVDGDVAWATSTSVTQGKMGEREINSAGVELMVLTKTPGGWVIRAIHWSSRNRRS